MQWKVLDSGRQAATENMTRDAALLHHLESEHEAILHFYEWEGDAATYGYFVNPSQFLNMEGVEKWELSLARRPTGGGIVFHNCDLAFSALVPSSAEVFSDNPLDNYAFINQKVLAVVETFLGESPSFLSSEPEPLDASCKRFCMAKPTRYDVMLGTKKVGGAAQRKTRYGYLHQGTISLGLLSKNYLNAVLAPGTRVLEGMEQHSFPLLGETWTKQQLQEARKELRELLYREFVR